MLALFVVAVMHPEAAAGCVGVDRLTATHESAVPAGTSCPDDHQDEHPASPRLAPTPSPSRDSVPAPVVEVALDAVPATAPSPRFALTDSGRPDFSPGRSLLIDLNVWRV